MKDILDYNLLLLFIGYNPGLYSEIINHHYASPSNRFWRLLYDSGLTDVLLKAEDDDRLLSYGYGSINVVNRATRSAAEITPGEYVKGKEILICKLKEYQPKIAVYTGIGVYRVLTGQRKIVPGLQRTQLVSNITDFVCPSPSGLNRWPYEKQLQCFKELKSLIQQKTQDR